MRIHLPLEVWVDVLAPISRPELANRLTEIGSRSFAEIAMFFLHEYGQIKLKWMSFGGDFNYFHKIPEVEMPANIKDFQSIGICAQDDQIDCSLLTIFFTNLRPLLSNVNLWCNLNSEGFDWFDKENQVPDFLNKLLPLIDSINSIHFSDHQCLDLVHEKFVDKFFAAKILSINYRIMKEEHEWPIESEEDDDDSEDERDDIDEKNNDEKDDKDGEGDAAQKYYDIVWKPRMAILRKWLLFNGNALDDDSNFVDQPRTLYVDEIPLEIGAFDMDDISKEFMKSTKPTRFIACFTTRYMDEEERHDFEAIRHVNQTTNEILSAKCFVLPKYELMCAVFLHSHPIVPDGEEHEGNMLLIKKILEKISEHEMDRRMDSKFVYSTNRHINIYRKGRINYYNSGCHCLNLDCDQCGGLVRWWLLEKEKIERKKKEEEEAHQAELLMMRHRKKPKNKKKKKTVIGSGEMDFLWQKELRTEAFERRMKSRIKGKEKLNMKKATAQMTTNGGIGEWWKKNNKKQKNMAEIFD